MAFLIMTGEDEHIDGTLHARRNVIHEIGLFQAQLGYEKAIILLEEGCEIFSNIQGITYIPFPKGNIRAAFEDIREVLKRESILEQERSENINHAANMDTDGILQEYWDEFRKYCDTYGLSLVPLTWNRNTQYSGFRLSIKSVSDRDIWLAAWRKPDQTQIAVNLGLRLTDSRSEDAFDALRTFNALEKEREVIESAFGGNLRWQEEPFFPSLGPVVGVYKDITPDRDDWQRQFEWMFTMLEKLNQVFCPFLRESSSVVQNREQ